MSEQAHDGWVGFGRETEPGPATPVNVIIGSDQFAAITYDAESSDH